MSGQSRSLSENELWIAGQYLPHAEACFFLFFVFCLSFVCPLFDFADSGLVISIVVLRYTGLVLEQWQVASVVFLQVWLV